MCLLGPHVLKSPEAEGGTLITRLESSVGTSATLQLSSSLVAPGSRSNSISSPKSITCKSRTSKERITESSDRLLCFPAGRRGRVAPYIQTYQYLGCRQEDVSAWQQMNLFNNMNITPSTLCNSRSRTHMEQRGQVVVAVLSSPHHPQKHVDLQIYRTSRLSQHDDEAAKPV